MFPTVNTASQNVSAEDVMDDDTFQSVVADSDIRLYGQKNAADKCSEAHAQCILVHVGSASLHVPGKLCFLWQYNAH